jgi:CubicO group peptidase (beta-lactamase class C family)
VRVNVLAYCLLQRFGRPLPDVLRERVMDPIGASAEWEWHGYYTSWTDVAGTRAQSVSGGAHWGGGMFISARDHVRLGLLIAAEGEWNGKEILPAAWIRHMLAPSPTNPSYGYMWWLNGAGQYKSAPKTSVFAMGAGTNLIWIEPSLDIVASIRWIDRLAVDDLLGRIVAAIQE